MNWRAAPARGRSVYKRCPALKLRAATLGLLLIPTTCYVAVRLRAGAELTVAASAFLCAQRPSIAYNPFRRMASWHGVADNANRRGVCS